MSVAGPKFDIGVDHARVDLVSNHSVFRDDDYVRALLRGEQLPMHTFSSFVHEATHHWCFISPVGTALSLLYLSVAKRALDWAITGDETHTQEALGDLCTFDVAVSWLRPLNEGLAQFAEYDVRPVVAGGGSLMSPPILGALTHLFDLPGRLTRSPLQDRTPVLYELADDIDRWRLSRQTIDRKGELLLQPLDSRGSAYLLGYLTVKSLWRNAARFYPELQHADTFLLFLRKLVFGDYSLVAAILDRAEHPHRRALRIGQLLAERFHLIRLMPFDDQVSWSEFEKVLTPSPPLRAGGFVLPDWTAFAGLDNQEAVDEGRHRLTEFLVEASQPPESLERLPEFPPDFFGNVLRERYLMWLGRCAARWESTGRRRGRVLMDDAVVADFKLEKATDEGLDALSLDLYVDLYEEYRLTTVSGDQGVFGFISSRDLAEPAMADVTSAKLDRQQIATITKILHETMPNYLTGTDYRDSLERLWLGGGYDLLQSTYDIYAFDSDEWVAANLGKDGISSVLENDPDLVRTVAAITLAASAGMTPEGLGAASPNLPVDPRDAIRRVGDRWGSDDFPLASLTNDGFLRSAF